VIVSPVCRYRIPATVLFGVLALNLLVPLDSLENSHVLHVALPFAGEHHHANEHSHPHSHGHGHPAGVPDHDHGALVESDACARPASHRVDDAPLDGTVVAIPLFSIVHSASAQILAYSSRAIPFDTPPGERLGILLI
jgi:hypothetical protein